MTQINKLKIGLALNAIAMLSDEFTYDRIKDRLKEIEQIVAEEPDTDDPEGETQKPKTGHWESTELFYEGKSRGSIIKCSECGNEFKVSPKVFERLYDNERFCNHCGCRMFEPQESEDKE